MLLVTTPENLLRASRMSSIELCGLRKEQQLDFFRRPPILLVLLQRVLGPCLARLRPDWETTIEKKVFTIR